MPRSVLIDSGQKDLFSEYMNNIWSCRQLVHQHVFKGSHIAGGSQEQKGPEARAGCLHGTMERDTILALKEIQYFQIQTWLSRTLSKCICQSRKIKYTISHNLLTSFVTLIYLYIGYVGHHLYWTLQVFRQGLSLCLHL